MNRNVNYWSQEQCHHDKVLFFFDRRNKLELHVITQKNAVWACFGEESSSKYHYGRLLMKQGRKFQGPNKLRPVSQLSSTFLQE